MVIDDIGSLEGIYAFLQGVFLYWSALKLTKCQTLSDTKIFSDGIYYVIWHLVIFGRNSKKKNTQ